MAFQKEAVRERDVENYCLQEFKKLGWLLPKWTSPSNRSVPDRIGLLPFGIVKLIEFKAPGKQPTPLQLKVHEKYRAMGHRVFIIDSKAKVDYYITLWTNVVQEARWKDVDLNT